MISKFIVVGVLLRVARVPEVVAEVAVVRV